MSFDLSLLAADPSIPEPERCEKLAGIVRQIELPDRKMAFLKPAFQAISGLDPVGEQVARSLFYVGTTWGNHVAKVRSLTNLRKLVDRRSRGASFGAELDARLDPLVGFDLEAYSLALSHAVDTGIFPSTEVVAVLPLEAACLRERTRHLADTADPYSLRTMARLLPLLRILDELADRLEVLHRESLQGSLQAPDLGLLKFLGEKDYLELRKIFLADPVAKELGELFEVQRRIQLDPPVVSALFTLSRTLSLPRPEATWLERIGFWLRSFDVPSGRWTIRCKVHPSCTKALERGGLKVEPSGISFRVEDLVLPSLLDEHTACIDLSGGRKPPPPEWKSLVLSNITRDTLIASFLANPKCVRVPGLVECVVVNSRSLQILSAICIKRDLCTGHQNKGVPAALLRSRCKIPMNLLRRFIHLRFVSRSELKDLATRAPRAEVQKEVEEYLANL